MNWWGCNGCSVTLQKQYDQQYADSQAAYLAASTATSQANQKAKDSYNQALAEWNAKHPSIGSGISTGNVKQALKLGNESTAKLNVSINNSMWNQSSEPWNVYGTVDPYEYIAPLNSYSGDILTATYTNLQNSSYIDSNNIVHRITKMIVTFSDVVPDNSAYTHNALALPNDCILTVNSNPRYGFHYSHIKSVNVNYQFYDQDGNLVSFEPNSAYMAITSLNNSGKQRDKWGFNIYKREKVNLLSSGKLYALYGSAITVHSDGLYSDRGIDFDTVHSDGSYTSGTAASASNIINNWDGVDQYEYYGTGLAEIEGSNVKLQFSKDLIEDTSMHYMYGDYVWATTTTIIPQTLGPTPPRYTTNTVQKPVHQVANVSYHSNTLI